MFIVNELDIGEMQQGQLQYNYTRLSALFDGYGYCVYTPPHTRKQCNKCCTRVIKDQPQAEENRAPCWLQAGHIKWSLAK